MKALLVAASLAGLLAAAPAGAQSSPQANLSGQDRQFIKITADGNLVRATLGELAQRKGGTRSVQELGRWMATDHNFANKWLMAIADRVNDNQQPSFPEKDKALEARLQGLSGAAFDQQYLQAVLENHEQTIQQFKNEAQNGQNPQVKHYAEALLPVLQQHLVEAQELAAAIGASGTSTPR